MLISKRMWPLLTLVIAGEAIFFLPFVLPRIFRVTLLQVFDITNLELGALFSMYGVVAIGAYFFGGPLADTFKARWLMSAALCITALSGLWLATIPSLNGYYFLYGFWGLSTLLLFWASLMRATREIGGIGGSSIAFGILDGGRGAIAAIIAALAVSILGFFMPDTAENTTAEVRQGAFQRVILYISGFVFLTGILVMLVLKNIGDKEGATRFSFRQMASVFSMPVVWLQATMIVCAYSAYRVTDIMPSIAQDMLGLEEVASASFATNALWLRPFGAILGGLLAVKFRTSIMVVWSFVLILTGGLVIGLGWAAPGAWWPVVLTMCFSFAAVYAMRGLYFAIMEEGKIPLAVTGTAVGLASIIGYLPDVYMAALVGWLIDRTPGAEGIQHVFLVMAGFAVIGIVAGLIFNRVPKSILPADG